MAQDYPTQVKKWDVFEVAVQGTAEGNPFIEQRLTGMFLNANEKVKINGFYDGDGVYKIRFMPSYEGKYTFFLRSTFFKETLSGSFYVEAADENNHGIVRCKDTYHFAYEDGSAYHSVGTTAYVWHLQDEVTRKQTLASLQESGFNKMRFCVFPKHYVYNFKDPAYFPYEGTPMDASVLTEENFMSYYENKEGNDFDFHRFNPEYFRNLDEQIENLGNLGIEADLILFHPYDRWGFSSMSAEEDQFYLKYMIDRYAAYRNVWWSMANEWDLLKDKTVEDWENIGKFVMENDPYQHLRSIHNCRELYDHSASWITHTSFQRVDLYKGAELTDELRQRYGKPVVNDEIAYEGDIPHGWGNITGEEMIRRFWETAVRGGYPGHGETYLNEDEVLWWSHGGKLKGESWKRAAFLKKVMDEVPGSGIAPLMNEWDSVVGTTEGENDLTAKTMYLYYYSFMRPSYREYFIDDETYYHVDIIDTWNMTIEDGGVHHGRFKVQLGSKQYMAVRLTKTDAPEFPEEEETTETAEPEEIVLPEISLTEETEQPSETPEVFVDFSFDQKEEEVQEEEPELDEPEDIPAPFINVFASEEARALEEEKVEEPAEEPEVSEEDEELPEVVLDEAPVEAEEAIGNTVQLLTEEITEEAAEEPEEAAEAELPQEEEKEDSLENTVKLLSPFSDVEDYMTATVVESTIERPNTVNLDATQVLTTHESASQISEMNEKEREDAEEIELPEIVKEVLDHSESVESFGKKIDDDDEETGHWTIPPINFMRRR